VPSPRARGTKGEKTRTDREKGGGTGSEEQHLKENETLVAQKDGRARKEGKNLKGYIWRYTIGAAGQWRRSFGEERHPLARD